MLYQVNKCVILLAERLEGPIDLSRYDTWLIKSAFNKVLIALDSDQLEPLNRRYPLITYNKQFKVVFSKSCVTFVHVKLEILHDLKIIFKNKVHQ